MKNSLTIIFLLASFVAMGLAQKPSPNRPPVIQRFETSEKAVYSCESFLTRCPLSSDEGVSLRVTASDPDNDAMTYEYSVLAGKISGKGDSVWWKIFDVTEGTPTATVTVTDSRGLSSSAMVQVIVEKCRGCYLPDPPPCPVVIVACPEEVSLGQAVTFVVTVSGGPPGMSPTYQWTVDSDRIMKGQGTSEIEVKLNG